MLSADGFGWSRRREVRVRVLAVSKGRKEGKGNGRGARAHALALAVYAVLAMVFTFPLILTMGRVSAAGDPAVMVWSMAWIQNALATGTPLYDANIFHPTPDALAYTDLLLPSALVTAPLFYATGNALLSWNIVLLLTYVLSGYAVFLLAKRLLGARPYALHAALFAGAVYALSPYRLGHITQLNTMTTYWLPLILLFMHRYLEDGRRKRDLALTGLFFALNALSGLYYGIFAVPMMAAFYGLWLLLNRSRFSARDVLRRDLLLGVPILALFGAALAAILWPYLALSGGTDHSRDLLTVARGSLIPLALLVSPPQSLLFGWTSEATGVTNDNGLPMYELTLYPGLAVSLLALYALVRRGASRVEALYAGVGAAIFVLSLGPLLRLGGFEMSLPYRLLYEFVPGFGNLRVPARMWAIVMLCLAVLAGLGLRALLERLGERSGRRAALALGLVCLVAALEFAPVLPMYRFLDPGPRELSPAYAYLAENADGETVVAEVPFANEDDPFRETPRMYLSTHGFWRLVNGYASYFPEDYDLTRERLNALPEGGSVAELRRLGAEYVIVHPEEYEMDGEDGEAVLRAAENEPALERVAGDDEAVLFRVEP